MEVANYLSTSPKNACLSEIFRASFAHFSERLRHTFTILLLVASVCGSAKAQYLGFAANSADGTVSVFAVATSGPSSAPNTTLSGNQDHLVATISVGKNPSRIAVTPSPNFNRAYVTNTGDNSLWVIDVTNVSQEGVSTGSITKQNVNPTNDQLQLFQPGGIAVAALTQGANSGKVLAFVANQGTNTVSVIDTSNNTLFETVLLGPAGSSTTLPEVAATPDGTKLFVTNNSSGNCAVQPIGLPPAICPGVWTIDTTVNPMSATLIPESGLNGNLTVSLVQPQGISATQYTDSLNQMHTLVLVADSGSHSDGHGYVFVVDRVNGSTVSAQPVQISNPSNSTAQSTPIGVAVMNFNGLATPASVGAAVIDSAGNGLTAFDIQPTLNAQPGAFALSGTPTSIGVPNPAGLRQFIYVTESAGPTPVQLATFDNTTFDVPNCSGSCFNATSVQVGNGPEGLAFNNLDRDSPPVVWFIPAVSGGIDIPAVVPHGSTQSALGAGIVGNGQSIQTTLNFGDTNCTLFRDGAPVPTSPPNCTAPANSGTNAIGGGTIFPASGVFAVQVTETSIDSHNNPTQGIARVVVAVGANCAWSPPSSVMVNVPVSATLSCTAPGKDTVTGTINWGDGTTETKSVTALGSTTVSLGFTSHTYSAANASGYQVTVSLQDIPPGAAALAGSVAPSMTTIVVTNLTLPSAPTIIAPGESAVIPVGLAGGSVNAGVTLTTSCSVSPAGGPVCSVSPAMLTLDSSGNGSVVVTVTANGSTTAILLPRGDEWPGPTLALFIMLLASLIFLVRCYPKNLALKRPRWGLALLLLASLIMLATGACTNVQRSNIGCASCTSSGSYVVTLNAKSAKPPLLINGVFSVVVTQ
jgi:YVTN family beta-propeller protein